MNNERVYLRQNVLIEPLFNQWYAWSYLLAPSTAPMYVANSHVKIMRSFVDAPQTHVAALKNPAMMGGPFINYDTSKVPQIKALLEKTLREQKHMLDFAESVKALDHLLASEADGHGLAPLYAKVPDDLRGYVELVYDLNNNPSIRFIEGLLYKSPYYDESSQSLAISLITRDGRPFVFSTPRLENGSELHLHRSFRDEGIDALCRMKTAPQPYGYIAERLGVREEENDLFASFFTTEEPPPSARYAGDGVRVRYLGHACVLVETREISVLTDPLLSYKYEAATDRFTYADLPERIDYVLLTHNHQDHCLFETLLQLRHRIGQVIVPKSAGGLADPSLRLLLQNLGFKNVREVEEMEAVEVDGGEITGLPFLGEHGDLNIRTKGAYLVTLKGRSILFAADSNNIEPRLYHNIHRVIGDVDVIFIGMECVGGPLSWLYGPLLTSPLTRKMDQSRRFDGSNYERAIGIVDELKPSHVYVYAMGQEPWLTFLTSLNYDEESYQIVESNRLVEECRRRGITAERVFCRKEIVLGPA